VGDIASTSPVAINYRPVDECLSPFVGAFLMKCGCVGSKTIVLKFYRRGANYAAGLCGRVEISGSIADDLH